MLVVNGLTVHVQKSKCPLSRACIDPVQRGTIDVLCTRISHARSLIINSISMRLQVAVLLLAGLAVASAATASARPKHPFFNVNPVTVKGHDEGYESTKLCLQNKHTCFASNGDGLSDYT